MDPRFRERIRRQAGFPEPERLAQPMPPAGALALAAPPVAPGSPLVVVKPVKKIADLARLCLLVAFIFNILLAIWIFTDIRKRGEGSGIFIVLALLAGIPAAIIYSLVRIGDKKP